MIVIITGISGSGKSVALRALEDEGYFCTDNLPVTLMESFVSIVMAHHPNTNIGMGIDIREKEFLHEFDSVLRSLKEHYPVQLIFLETEKEVLLRRYKETRRPHPLVSDDTTLEDAISREVDMLLPLKSESDRIIDTSSYTPHQLRHFISSSFKTSPSYSTITLISFGYKFGIPQNVDLLFDVRFIPNPYFIPSLKELDGTSPAVREFVFGQPSTGEFLDRTSSLLNFLIPRYIEEGKAYLTIGFGCTGGRHRSPAIVERIATLLKDFPVEVNIVHRDMES